MNSNASLSSIDNGDVPFGIETNFFPYLIYGPYFPLLAKTVSFLYSPNSLGRENKLRACSNVTDSI